MAEAPCCCCGTPMCAGLAPWHRCCPACGYEAAAFEPAINDATRHAHIDERQREAALKPLRMENFRALLQQLPGLGMPVQGRLLDVGAAHGWFVGLAALSYRAKGLEPDRAVCAQAQAAGYPVVLGYFPQALAADERFDAIVFNDVFEHLPEPAATLAACHRHLQPGGLLVLNLPSSEGPFYRLARLLMRAGMPGPFERLWQKGLPSPHLHYFNAANLQRLAAQAGFAQAWRGALPALRWRGLYARIAFAGGSPVGHALRWLAVTLALPLLRFFPSDIALLIVRRQPPAGDAR